MFPIPIATDTMGMAESPSTVFTGELAQPAYRPWLSRLIHWFAEARSHRVICLVLAVWLLNGFDLALTILAHDQGMLAEENPVARRFLADGPVFLILFKVGLVLIGSYPLLRFRRLRLTELATLVILVAYGLLAVHWSACYELYTLTASGHINMAEIDAIE
jgi:hypothetical protein